MGSDSDLLPCPHEYEPDYDAWWRDIESQYATRANVAAYDDWFPDQHGPKPPAPADWSGTLSARPS